MRARNAAAQAKLADAASLLDYAALVREEGGRAVWSDALQRALDEREIVRLPASATPYWIDRTVMIPSNRRIEAEEGATVRLVPGMDTIFFRNEHTHDGTHAPIAPGDRDRNVAILGGRWEESREGRAGYGRSGKHDAARSLFGVSTLFFFNNLRGLTLENIVVAHAAGFAVQVGDVEDLSVRNIRFDDCYADGLHVNGNTSCAFLSDIRGNVGDDLVALNAYDWLNSSVDCGPIRDVVCEDLELVPEARYKAMRFEPGRYTYDDGPEVDCSVERLVVRRVRGIRTFKLYFQTPPYRFATERPETGGQGTGDDLFFEDIDIDLAGPIDELRPYLESDPVRGTFAAFEFGSLLGRVRLERIRLTLHRDRFPYSYLACTGPKSVVRGDLEIFDPGLSTVLRRLEWRDIEIDGRPVRDLSPYLRAIAIGNARGTFGEIVPV